MSAFAASFGGIFGLCLGGSLISFIEIFYFFSLRLYASYNGMAEKATSAPENDNQKRNEVNIFKISTSFPTDDAPILRYKMRDHQSKSDNFPYTSTKYHDRYLD